MSEKRTSTSKNNYDNESSGVPSCCKKLRSQADPDLCVVLGRHQDTTLHHYSHALAFHSEYIDAALSSGLEECATRTLTFPDIELGDWTRLLACVEDPVEARRMQVQEAIRLLPLYDKYQFPKGKTLCAEVLDQFLSRNDRWTRLDLNTLVKVVLAADAANLESTMSLVWDLFLTAASEFVDCTDLFSRFNLDDVRQLAPVLVKHEGMVRALDSTTEELQNPLFPKLWDQSSKLDELSYFLIEQFPNLLLSNTGYHFDGQYASTTVECGSFASRRAVRFPSLGPHPIACKITLKPNGEWYMMGTPIVHSNEQKIVPLWWNVGTRSCHYLLPPRIGWISAHPITAGSTPTIEYIYCQDPELQHIDFEAPFSLS